MLLWHTLATYFRRKYGVRVQKIPLDAGATCPNRDGSRGSGGFLRPFVDTPRRII